MDFILAGTFVQALNRLPARDQKDVKISVMDLQLNPATPSLSLHRVDKSKDPNFWSARVNRDIRLILHRTARSLLVAYVDHHDAAYGWAIRRKIEAHPKTSVMQIVQIPERVAEVEPELASKLKTQRDDRPTDAAVRPFSQLASPSLLAIGVPQEWIPTIQSIDENTFLEIAHLLPPDAADALIAFASDEITEALSACVDAFPNNRSIFGTRAIDDPHFRDELVEIIDSTQRQIIRSSAIFGKRNYDLHSGYNTTDPFDRLNSMRQFIKINSTDDLFFALETPCRPWTPERERPVVILRR